MNDEELTCYHEAGHAVIGYLLGGNIEQVRLGGEPDDNLPLQFGDCLIHWRTVDPNCSWQIQREVLTLLAGPVAEMIYRGERLHPAYFAPWQMDWAQAIERAALLCPEPEKQVRLLEILIDQLYSRLRQDEYWAAVAAVADELSAHEILEQEQLEGCLQFWLSSN